MNISNKIFIILFFALCLVSCKSNPDSNLILIDTSQSYPVSDLRLSDVADVTYIPLKFGPDSTIFVNPGLMSVAVFRDTIFALNWKPPLISQIILYDTLGNPLRKIDRIGRGPQEYLMLYSWTLDTLQREIYAWDSQSTKLLIYDFNGDFKREKILKHSGQLLANLNAGYLLRYSENSLLASPFAPEQDERVVKTKHKTITLIRKDDLQEEVLDFDYIKPSWTSNFIENLSVTTDGIYITSDRSDTVYFLDRQLKLTPRIVDITPHSKRRNSVIRPSIETKRYIFLSNEFLVYYSEKKRSSPLPDYYVYDKVKKQVFQLKKDPAYTQGLADNIQQLLQNYVALNQFTATQNHNYAALFLSPLSLKTNYPLLPPRLKAITDTLDELDNPVLMLIKFR